MYGRDGRQEQSPLFWSSIEGRDFLCFLPARSAGLAFCILARISSPHIVYASTTAVIVSHGTVKEYLGDKKWYSLLLQYEKKKKTVPYTVL